jgi:hypothetical protein
VLEELKLLEEPELPDELPLEDDILSVLLLARL